MLFVTIKSILYGDELELCPQDVFTKEKAHFTCAIREFIDS